MATWAIWLLTIYFVFIAVLFCLGVWTAFDKRNAPVERFRGAVVSLMILFVIAAAYLNVL